MSTVPAVFRSDATHLSGLASLAADSPGGWQPNELGEVWRYQLDAPLEFDLTEQLQAARTTYAAVSSTTQNPPKTFRELLAHPHPALDLLQTAKDFAKKQSQGSETTVPREIALALYFAIISVALIGWHQRITSLPDTKLRQGIKWAIAQPWLDAATRTLCGEGLKQIPI